MAVTYQVSGTGTASAPVDGQIDLVSDLDDVICTIIDADSTNAETATFSCRDTRSEPGERQMTTTFGSVVHP